MLVAPCTPLLEYADVHEDAPLGNDTFSLAIRIAYFLRQ